MDLIISGYIKYQLVYTELAEVLENRSFNITKRFLRIYPELSRRIIEIFQDAKFEQELRTEIEKVKPYD